MKRMTKKFLVDAIVQQELDWVDEGETERFTDILRKGVARGFKGYSRMLVADLIQVAKDFDIWDSVQDQWGQRCDL